MSRRLKIAVMLHAGADGTAAGTREQARHAEQLGLDGIFVGDHLKPAGPYPESIVALAAAAGVTERIQLVVGVMVLFSGMATPQQIADGARRLPQAAQIAVGGMALLGADAANPRIDRLVASLIDGRGIPPEDAARLPITGTPAQAAERFAAYADAGATWLVLGTISDDWHGQ
jgi:alkanesulfonate monooxygenase SsuD/methylene tetrahydromethanopterin reductase-like flavin-dependent oxidoreductase (luciferase family)